MVKNQREILKAVLTVLRVVGVISVAILAPNALQIFAQRHRSIKKFNGVRLKRSIVSMQRQGFVSIVRQKGQTKIQITTKGRKRLLKAQLMSIKIKTQEKWDKKWRIVIFDIPERFIHHRHMFQRGLKNLGFIMLQKSVWVYPFPCAEEITYFKEAYEVIPYVKLITAENIDTEVSLIKQFNLK